MRSEVRQRQILGCAKKVFAERGYHAANISHICAEAGIGRGTLYQYFRNKKAVLVAILRDTLDRIERHVVEQRLGRRFPAPEKLSRAAVVTWSADRLRELFATAFEDEASLRITLREAVGLDVDIEQLLREIDDSLISVLEDDLRAAQEAGIVRELNPRLTATMMVGGVEKLVLAALRSDEPLDLELLAREASRLHHLGLLSERVQGD